MLRHTIFFILLLSAYTATATNTHIQGRIPSPLYGITLDDVSEHSITAIIDAIKALPVKPTARIVIDADKKPADFVSLLAGIHEVAYIMLCPCDSYDMAFYKTAESYKARFAECAAYLAPYVDIWEIGNEVNGEGWLGDSEKLIAEKVYTAWKYIHQQGFATALTAYMADPDSQSIAMEDWLLNYIPPDMRNTLDYVLVSYYDDDNDGKHEEWQNMFKNLYNMFPNSLLGFGECGFAKPHNAGKTFNTQADRYYRMLPYNHRYIGGYFWWYWQEDCIPHKQNSRWSKIADNFLWMKEQYR